MNRSGVLRLSHPEFAVLWRRMGLGERPLLLDVPDHSPTLDERDRLDDQAWEQLRARGLVEGRGPHPEVADVLSALARPTVEADLRMLTGPARQVRVLACAAGLVGVVAVAGAGTVDLRPVHPAGLAGELLAHVPEHRPAAGDAVAIPVGLAGGAGLRADTGLSQLERAGLRPDEARQVRRLLTGSVLRRFKIGAAARDRLGRRQRARDVVSVLDTEHGRVQIHHQRHHGGDRLLLAPAGKQRLASEVGHLVRAAAHTATSAG